MRLNGGCLDGSSRFPMRGWHLPLLLVLLLLLPQTGYSEMLRYLDEHGTATFVDDTFLSPVERQDLQQKVFSAKRTLRESGTTKVQIHGNQVLVPVEISDGYNRVTARLLLDTGASQTFFHRRSIDRLQLKPLGKGRSRLAGGQLIATDRVRLGSLDVGPHTWESPTVYVIDIQDSDIHFDGLLGMDFLMKHHYRIDFERQLIQWQDE